MPIVKDPFHHLQTTAELTPGAAAVRVVMAPRTSAPAMVGFVFSMLWLGWVGSIIGIVLGHYGHVEIDGSRGQIRGRGLATAAMWIGGVSIAIPVLVVLYAIGTAL